MKRATTCIFIAAMLAVIMIAGFGCGNGQPAQPTPTPTPTATAVEPTPTQTQNGTAAELPDTYQYSIELTDQANLLIVINIRVKGEKARSDYAITPPEEDTDTTVLIDDGEFDWVYDPDQNQVAKHKPGAGADPAAFYSLWFTSNYYGAVTEGGILSALQASCAIDPLCESVETSGHDTVAGQACTVFTVTGNEGRVIEYCISAGGYPLRISLTDFGFTSTMTFTDIDLNPDIPESIFDIHSVAPGAQIIDNT
jgi:outer membrane lipoprotein-sorting protein